MTRQENILLKILIIISLLCFFFLTTNSSVQKINESTKKIESYRTMIQKISQKEKNIDVSTSKEIQHKTEQKLSTSELAGQILSDLKTYGIIPLNYQIISDKENNFIETQFKCTGTMFAKYLNSFTEDESQYSIYVLNIKNDGNQISANIKYSLSAKKLYAATKNQTDEHLARLFRPIYREVPPAKEIKKEVTKETIKNKSSQLKIIGSVTDNDNVNNIFIKDINTNRVTKILPSDIIENTESHYIILYNSEKIQIDKR